MKSSLIVIICLLSSLTFAQINQKDAKGRKQGPWEKSYPKSSVLEYKGQFLNDQPTGTFTYYFPSNKVKAIIKHDITTGRSEAFFYHENGNIMTYGIYRNQKKDSLWFNYNEDGKIVYTETFENDVLNGKKTVYFPPNKETGKVERVATVTYFKNGKAEGEFIEYFEHGATRTKGAYLNGQRQGVWMDYQPNGKPLSMTRYKNGQRHGWCSAYDALGKEINKEYYYYGQLKTGKDLEFIMKQMKEKGINPND